MESFLSKTADHIIANHNNNLHKVCIVLPTRRSGVFLKKEISAKIETVSFAPDIYSISDFVEMLGDIHVVDELDLLFEFYIAYQSTCIQPDSFENYLNWAPIMLNDFRDIDNYMVPSQDIFSYINEAYAYKVWNPEGKEPTDSQREYLRFWSEFGSKYNALKEHLLANNIAHEGLSAFSAATNILNRKPKTINIKDECSLLFNNLIHIIKTKGNCESLCKNKCSSYNLKFKSVEFKENRTSCNTCECFCN